MRRTPPFSLALATFLLVAGCGPAARPSQGLPQGNLVLISERYDHVSFGKRVRTILQGGRFDRLEAIADSLERCDVRWRSGRSVLTSFYEQGFATVNDPDDPGLWETHLSRLREWADARANSAVAQFALAEALIGRAWAARGTGWAKNVSTDRWRRQWLEKPGGRATAAISGAARVSPAPAAARACQRPRTDARPARP